MIGLIGGATLLLSALPSGTPPAHPLQLETTTAAGRVTFQVRGHSATPFRGRYSLRIVADNGNRSIHAGRFQLLPDAHVTLSTITISVPATAHWSATLEVEPEGSDAYSVTSAAAGADGGTGGLQPEKL